jgi:hypothetical protein
MARRTFTMARSAGPGPLGRRERRVASGQVAHAFLVAAVLAKLLAELEMIAVEDQALSMLSAAAPYLSCNQDGESIIDACQPHETYVSGARQYQS